MGRRGQHVRGWSACGVGAVLHSRPHLTRPFSAPVQPNCWAMGINATDMLTWPHGGVGVSARCPGCACWVLARFSGLPLEHSPSPPLPLTLSMLHSTNDAEVAATSIHRCGMPNTPGPLRSTAPAAGGPRSVLPWGALSTPLAPGPASPGVAETRLRREAAGNSVCGRRARGSSCGVGRAVGASARGRQGMGPPSPPAQQPPACRAAAGLDQTQARPGDDSDALTCGPQPGGARPPAAAPVPEFAHGNRDMAPHSPAGATVPRTQ